MSQRWLIIGLLFALGGLLASRESSAAPLTCPPAPENPELQIQVRPRENNVTIADAVVHLPRSAPLFIEYGDSGGWLRTVTGAANQDHRIPLLQLHADSTYEARAFTLGADGCPSTVARTTFQTAPLPEALRGTSIQSNGQASFPLLFMDWPSPAPFLPPGAPGDRSRYLVGTDPAGQIVWYYLIPSDLPIPPPEASAYPLVRLGNGNLLYLAGYYGLEEITPDGQLVRRLRSEDPAAARAHHEVLELPDGHLLYLGAEDQPANDGSGTVLRGDTLHEVDPLTQDLTHLLDPVNGAGRRVWGGFETLESTDRPAVWSGWKIQGAVDWTHANAMTLGAPGTVLISLRHLDQIISVSLATGQIQWKLGGADSSFRFTNPDDLFHGQHAVIQLPNGHLLLFDNGNYRPSGEYSRALELELDQTTMTARQVWQYRPQPDIFADKLGNVVRLSNGNTLVHFGWREAPDEPSLVQEVRPDGQVVWQQATRWRGIRAARFRVYPAETIGGERSVDPTPLAEKGTLP